MAKTAKYRAQKRQTNHYSHYLLFHIDLDMTKVFWHFLFQAAFSPPQLKEALWHRVTEEDLDTNM